MNDTSPEIERRFRKMMMEKSGEERLRMGFSMFDFVRRQVIASIKEKNPEADEIEIKKEIFLRFYGHEFSNEELKSILKHLFLHQEKDRD
ncbi:MAG: hypothetical protein V3U15_03360 [Nitrospinota bacterium]